MSAEWSGWFINEKGVYTSIIGGAGTLLAFTWNFNTPFGENVFSSPINGIAFGQITTAPVPEPMPLALLSIGLIGLTLTRRLHKHG